MELPMEVYAWLNCYPDYQKAKEAVEAAEADYLALRESLTPRQQEVLERYLTACEEADHLLARICYDCGRSGR